MKFGFDNYVEKVPADIYSDSKTFISEHIAMFEPQNYIIDKPIMAEDFHFVLFHSKPPGARIGKREYEFKKGSLLVIEPGMDVTIMPVSNAASSRYMSICIKRNFFQNIILEATEKEKVVFHRIESIFSQQLLQLIGNFQYELITYGNSCPQMIQSIATQIGIQLMRDFNNDVLHRREKNFRDKKYIDNAIEYIHTYYNSNISIIDMCHTVYVSPGHLKRTFKEVTGVSPHQYLMRVRVDKAKELLLKDECSIEETARLCGFVNTGHFSTVFKRMMQMKPSEYRRRVY